MAEARENRIVIAGVGGQGVIFAARVLAQAALLAGYHVAQTASYGAEARGTPAWAGVVASPDPVVFPYPEECDFLLALARPGFELFRKRLAPGGVVFSDAAVGEGTRIPAREIALELGSEQAANMVLLGAFASGTGFVPLGVLERALEVLSPERFRGLNLEALRAGFEVGRDLGEHAGRGV